MNNIEKFIELISIVPEVKEYLSLGNNIEERHLFLYTEFFNFDIIRESDGKIIKRQEWLDEETTYQDISYIDNSLPFHKQNDFFYLDIVNKLNYK